MILKWYFCNLNSNRAAIVATNNTTQLDIFKNNTSLDPYQHFYPPSIVFADNGSVTVGLLYFDFVSDLKHWSFLPSAAVRTRLWKITAVILP